MDHQNTTAETTGIIPGTSAASGSPTHNQADTNETGSDGPFSSSSVGSVLSVVNFVVPSHDTLAFAKLPENVRTEILLKLKAFRAIKKAVTIQRGCKQQAALYHCQPGFSVKRLRAQYDKYISTGGDWRTLVNRAKAGPTWWETNGDTTIGLPADFVQFWKSLCEQNKRKSKPAHRELLHIWRTHHTLRGVHVKQIPGYDTWPTSGSPSVLSASSVGNIPLGWSYRNLMHLQNKCTKFELTASRVGTDAAAVHRPLVYTTRANLYVGSHYLFDDLWHDHFVNILDTKQTGRPLEFAAHDLYSACKFAWGMRVRVENDLTGKMEGLKENMMRLLVAQVLADHGYSPRGTILVVEHGTAAISEALEQILSDLSGGKITIARSGISGGGDALACYQGRGKGNFRFKASLESAHNLVHNEMATLPGQTGPNRERRPESLHGLLKHNDALMNALVALEQEKPERAKLLRFELLEFRQFLSLATDIYHRINTRTDHRLEGWNDLCVADEVTRLIRRLSPHEVWRAGKPQLNKITPAQVALIIGSDSELAVERQVKNHRFEFIDKELSPDPVGFLALDLVEGQKYLAVVNPFSPDTLFAFDAAGRFLTVCDRIQRACKSNVEALHHACGRAASIEKQLLAPVAARGRDITQQRIDDARHNARVLDTTKPFTDAEKSAHRAARSPEAREAADDILAPEHTSHQSHQSQSETSESASYVSSVGNDSDSDDFLNQIL